MYYGAAHYANLDLEVGVLISFTLAFTLLALATPSEKKRSLFFISAYIFAGLAALTKGLIGIAFPMMVIGSWILLLNRWAILRKMHIVTGMFLFAAIALPWYVLVQKANPEFLHFFFVTQQVARFLTKGDYNNRTVVWFYLPVVFFGLFPWCIFLLQALSKNCKAVWQNRQQYAHELFLLLWFGIIFIFFSIPKSKTVGYIIPVFFPLAIMVGRYLDQIWGETRTKGFARGVKTFIGFSLVAAISCIVATCVNMPKVIYPGSAPYLIAAATLFSLASVMTLYFYKQNAFGKIILCLTTSSMIGLLILLSSTGTINIRSIKPLALQIKAQLKPDDEVISYLRFYQDLPIYLQKRVTIVADWSAPDIAKNDNWQRELWYGMPFQNTQQWLIGENEFWQRWHSNKHVYVVMSTNSYPEFMAKAGESVQQMGVFPNAVWVSNQ